MVAKVEPSKLYISTCGISLTFYVLRLIEFEYFTSKTYFADCYFEKPFSSNAEEARRMKEEAERTNLVLMEVILPINYLNDIYFLKKLGSTL